MKLRSFAPLLGLCLLLSIGIPALACINLYGTNIEGEALEKPGSDHSHLEHIDPASIRVLWQAKLSELEAQYKPDANYRIRSDYAAALIHTGDANRAIEILLDVEQRNPGLYVTATNLGTAYELSGDNEWAMHWIKEGIRRNKNSHHGSEWVHVRILEAKRELARNPQWLKQNTVLGLNFGTDNRPLMPVTPVVDFQGREVKPEDVIAAAQFQLKERLQFVSAPDPIVADMLFDLGNYTALTNSVESAARLYKMALKFDHPQKGEVQARLDYMKSIANSTPAGRTAAWFVVGFCVLFVIWGLLRLMPRRRTS